MKIAQYSLTISEPVACVKPGRTVLLKVCVLVLCLIGVVAVGGMIWAEVTGFNLNKLPWIPRILLAVAAGLAAAGIFRSVREENVPLELAFFRDRLTLTYAGLPSLWREGTVRQETEIPYDKVTSCILSNRRMRLTLQAKRYTRIIGEQGPKTGGGTVSFSTLSAGEADIAGLIRKYTPVRVTVKD